MMISASTGKEITKRYQINITHLTDVGFIEDVNQDGKSFNVFRLKKPLKRSAITSDFYKFVQSCYKLQTALSILNNLNPKQAKPKWL